MAVRVNIVELADQLIANAQASKTASEADAVPVATVSHPVALLLKSAAAALRAQPDEIPVTSINEVQKLAMALGGNTGAQSSVSGTGKLSTPPALPGLQTSNMGLTAGAGGSAPVNKIATELRKLASIVRTQTPATTTDNTTAAHVLNAACGLQHLAEGFR